jgi:DNA-binding response OmpR family regulator
VTELELLRLFARHPNQALSRDEILDATQHRQRDPFDRSVDLHVTRLRRKIEFDPEKPTTIRTVRGLGYLYSSQGP